MIGSLGSWSVALVSGALAFLVFLARGWLDWRFVYGDYVADDDILTTLFALVFYGAIAAAWTWSRVATARERRGGASDSSPCRSSCSFSAASGRRPRCAPGRATPRGR